MALAPDKRNEHNSHEQRKAKQDDVDGDGVVVERFVGRGVEGCLREVEESGETDDEAIDFAEGSEAEDFGGVVAVKMLVVINRWLVRGILTTRRCSRVVGRGRRA